MVQAMHHTSNKCTDLITCSPLTGISKGSVHNLLGYISGRVGILHSDDELQGRIQRIQRIQRISWIEWYGPRVENVSRKSVVSECSQ
jgi:hypothetical protein